MAGCLHPSVCVDSGVYGSASASAHFLTPSSPVAAALACAALRDRPRAAQDRQARSSRPVLHVSGVGTTCAIASAVDPNDDWRLHMWRHWRPTTSARPDATEYIPGFILRPCLSSSAGLLPFPCTKPSYPSASVWRCVQISAAVARPSARCATADRRLARCINSVPGQLKNGTVP